MCVVLKKTVIKNDQNVTFSLISLRPCGWGKNYIQEYYSLLFVEDNIKIMFSSLLFIIVVFAISLPLK